MLGQILSPSLFSSLEQKPATWLRHCGSYRCRCGSNRCQCSKYIESYTNGTRYKIKGYIKCNVGHLVYLISCTTCRLQYVGCTIQTLKQRFCRHLSDTNFSYTRSLATISAVSHCIECHEGSTASIVVQGTERVSAPQRGGDYRRKVLNRESYWMFTLATRTPAGLNRKPDLILCY